MRVGVPFETRSGETRVALVPEGVAKLRRAGVEVVVQRGAGARAGFADEAYADRGAEIVERTPALAAEVVLALDPPSAAELREGLVLVCTPDPLGRPARVAELAGRGVSCFALELLPRISRAQAMDVLSSMATVAGYKAVLLAAAHAPKMFPLLMTAAGTVRPAKVFVLGAGVAGLQAIATARRLGAVVDAFDIRPDTKEQVESLGARFVVLDVGAAEAQDAGGYAKELSPEQKARQAELMAKEVQAADVVITTAQVPGRRSPILVPAKVVEGMRPGSVVVDLAAEGGGNCELTRADEEVSACGVTILGPCNLPATVPGSASQLYSNNLVNFLGLLVKDGTLALDLDDELVRGTLACHRGEVTSERIREALPS